MVITKVVVVQARFAIFILPGKSQPDIGLDAVSIRVFLDLAYAKGITAPGPGDLLGIIGSDSRGIEVVRGDVGQLLSHRPRLYLSPNF